MRSLLGLLCLGLLASTAPVDAKKPRTAPQRGSRDVGEDCATTGACKAGLKCVAAACRTPEWVAGAAIIVDHARKVEAELNLPLERREGGRNWNAMVRASVVMQATRAAMPDASEFDVRVALQNGDVPFDGVLDSFRLMAVESRAGQRGRESASSQMAATFPPMRLKQAYDMLFGPGTKMPQPKPRVAAFEAHRLAATAPTEAPVTGPADVVVSASSHPEFPVWPPEQPSLSAPARAAAPPPTRVAGKTAAGPLDSVDRMEDLARLIPAPKPSPAKPTPRVYSGIGEYVGPVGPDGMPEGEGRMAYIGGGSYEGLWQAGQWHGAGTLVRPDGQIVRGTFERGHVVKGETFTPRREN